MLPEDGLQLDNGHEVLVSPDLVDVYFISASRAVHRFTVTIL